MQLAGVLTEHDLTNREEGYCPLCLSLSIVRLDELCEAGEGRLEGGTSISGIQKTGLSVPPYYGT